MQELPEGLFIGGRWQAAHDGARLAVLDPASEGTIAEVAQAGAADALRALDAAEQAQRQWAKVAPRVRAEVLRRAFEGMHREREALARLITQEAGKPLAESRGEVDYAAEYLRWFSEEAVRIPGELIMAPSGANRIVVGRHPVGVALCITPWNFPAAMVTRKLGPAIAAGCAVLLKPAGETPLTALALARLFEEAGLPAGVLSVLPAGRERSIELVNALLADARVRKLSFTGSTATGRVLLGLAARNVVRCSMELGGNAPFIVFADADLEQAVQSALIAKMRNTGQACTAANRFIVERPVAGEFAARFAAAVAAMKVGPGLDESSQVGPLISAGARARVSALVRDALAAGARGVLPAAELPARGWFVAPAVLTDVPADAPILAEEIFGPVAPVVAFESEAEAIALANATEHGLASYVHAGDTGRGLRVAGSIEAGMVGLNRGMVSDPAAPFGGWKQSGLGVEGAHEGLLEYLQPRYIAASW